MVSIGLPYARRRVCHTARPQCAPHLTCREPSGHGNALQEPTGAGFVVYSLIHPKRAPDDGVSPANTVDAHRADLRALDTMCSHHGADAPEWFPVRPAHPCSGDNSSPCCQPEPARAASPVSRPGPTPPRVVSNRRHGTCADLGARRRPHDATPDMDVQALDRPVSEQPIRLRGDATPTTVEQDLASLHRCSVHATGNRGARRNRPTPHAPRPRTDGFDPHVRSKNTMPHRRGRSPGLTYRPAGGARHGTVHRSRAALGYRLNMTPDHRIRRHPHNGRRRNRPATFTRRVPSAVRHHPDFTHGTTRGRALAHDPASPERSRTLRVLGIRPIRRERRCRSHRVSPRPEPRPTWPV